MALSVTLVWFAVAPASALAGKTLSGTMVANGGAQATTSATVIVVAQVRGARTMRYREQGDAYSGWEAYTAIKTLELGADGPKVVEGQFRSANGARVTLTASILLDSTGPTTTCDYDGLPRATVTATLTAVDALSEVAATWYRLDGGTWRQGTTMTLHRVRKRGGLSAGAHTLEFYSVDALGNVGPIGSSVIVLQ